VAAQIKSNDKGLLSRDVMVRELVALRHFVWNETLTMSVVEGRRAR
jgi:hypothetical protein